MRINVGGTPPPGTGPKYDRINTEEKKAEVTAQLKETLEKSPGYEPFQAKRYAEGTTGPAGLAIMTKEALSQLGSGLPTKERTALKNALADLDKLAKSPPANLDEAMAMAQQTKAILEKAKSGLGKEKASAGPGGTSSERLDKMLKLVDKTMTRLEDQKANPVNHLNGASIVLANGLRDQSAKGSYELMVNGGQSEGLSKSDMQAFAKQTPHPNVLWGHSAVKKDVANAKNSSVDSSTGMGAVQTLSKENIKRLEQEIKSRGGMTAQDKEILRAFSSCDFIMSHSTTVEGRAAIEGSGKMLSKVRIENLSTGSEPVHNNTPAADEKLLRNNDFVFFRFEAAGASDANSRYGDETFRFNAKDTQLFQRGWITMEDQLTPKVIEPMRGPEGNLVRKTSTQPDPKNEVFHTDPLKPLALEPSLNKTVRLYRQTPDGEPSDPEAFKLHIDHHTQRQVFFGPDITKGVALSVIAELKRINDPSYSGKLGVPNALEQKKFDISKIFGSSSKKNNEVKEVTPEMAQALLRAMFRPEAKLPKEVFLGSTPGEVFSKGDAT